MFNKGDTIYLILNYEVNGHSLEKDAYQEIELQINVQGSFNSIKKLLSENSIAWGTIQYIDENNVEQTFTGYFAYLSQEETFRLDNKTANVQLRIMVDNKVGSSSISDINVGNTLSKKVLYASAD